MASSFPVVTHPTVVLPVYVLSQNCEKRLLVSPYLSVRPSVRPSAWRNSASNGKIFTIFDMEYFSKASREISLKSVKNKGYFT
jgi:hypothetical protein